MIAKSDSVVTHEPIQVDCQPPSGPLRQRAGEDIPGVEEDCWLIDCSLLVDQRSELRDTANALHVASPKRRQWIQYAFYIVGIQNLDSLGRRGSSQTTGGRDQKPAKQGKRPSQAATRR